MRDNEEAPPVTASSGLEGVLECRRLTPEWTEALASFLRDLSESGEERFFHPHGFDEQTVDALGRHLGKDLYYVLTVGSRVIGYGMLRGWDEGYMIPSLGIAIHPSARRSGLGKALMVFLHAAAARKGARAVRLRVSGENEKAIAMYMSLGYRFVGEEAGLQVGVLELGGGSDGSRGGVPVTK